jgi:hypothetical protein
MPTIGLLLCRPLVGFFERALHHGHEHAADPGRRRPHRRLRGRGRGAAAPPASRLADLVVPVPDITPVLARTTASSSPTSPGFGASSKPVDRQYSLALFASVLDALVDRLGLDDLGLVVHDLGGPIGVHWALHRPERVSRLAILNTLLYPEFDPSVLEFFTTLMDENKREQLVSDDGLREILRVGVSDPDALSAEALDGVTAPFRRPMTAARSPPPASA